MQQDESVSQVEMIVLFRERATRWDMHCDDRASQVEGDKVGHAG